MNKQEYKEYLLSSDWLIKKSKLIMVYLKQNWEVKCIVCDNRKNLVVHHLSYEYLNEKELTDAEVCNLSLLCKGCHYKWHFEDNFVNKWTNNFLNDLLYGKK